MQNRWCLSLIWRSEQEKKKKKKKKKKLVDPQPRWAKSQMTTYDEHKQS